MRDMDVSETADAQMAASNMAVPNMDSLVGALLCSCSEHVLETMFFAPVLDEADPEAGIGCMRVVSGLHFEGKPSGDFEVDADPGVARSLAAGFLGIDDSEVTGAQIDEVMTEFCNMTCGSALSSLGRVEYFTLEAPETSRPIEFASAVAGVRRGFLLEGGTLAVCLRVDFDRT
jgi:chemotaxis phosphatase CheX-like protein